VYDDAVKDGTVARSCVLRVHITGAPDEIETLCELVVFTHVVALGMGSERSVVGLGLVSSILNVQESPYIASSPFDQTRKTSRLVEIPGPSCCQRRSSGNPKWLFTAQRGFFSHHDEPKSWNFRATTRPSLGFLERRFSSDDDF
jgi:hypothetical protein